MAKKIVYTLASVASKAGMSPKVARAKFRRMKDERPFDHRKVKQFTSVQAKAAIDFLKTDHRTAE